MLLNMVSQGVGLLIGSDHRQMHTADTLLKPFKQDALQEEGTQPRSGFAPANRQTTA